MCIRDSLVYPVSYREKRDKFIRGEITWDGQAIEGSTDSVSTNLLDEDGNKISFVKYSIEDLSNYRISKVVLLLKKIDTISYLMTFIQNFSSSDTNIRAVHLREFTSRTSHLLEASSTQYYDQEKEKVAHDFEYSDSFSILSIIKVFSEMLGINCSSRSILTTTLSLIHI